MNKPIEAMKRELAELGGRSQNDNPRTKPETEQERDRRLIMEVYGHLIDPVRSAEHDRTLEEAYKRRLEAENEISKTCPECFRKQPIANETCELCGAANSAWLPGEERAPNHDGFGGLIDANGNVHPNCYSSAMQAHGDRNWRKRMSTTATVEELKHLAKDCFTSASSQWCVKHVQRVLHLRGEEAPLSFWGEMLDHTPIKGKPESEPSPEVGIQPRPTPEQIAAYFDEQIRALDAEIARHPASANEEKVC